LRKEPQFIDAVFTAKANRTKMEEEPVENVPSTDAADSFIISQNGNDTIPDAEKHKNAFHEKVYEDRPAKNRRRSPMYRSDNEVAEREQKDKPSEFDLSNISARMQSDEERVWIQNNLKIAYDGSNVDNYNSFVSGMGMSFDVFRTINEQHYGAYSPDNIVPVNNAFSVLNYADGHSAAVAYKGLDNCVFTMSFPFECIKDVAARNSIIKGIITYMTNK